MTTTDPQPEDTHADATMKITVNPQRASTLVSNLERVASRISSAAGARPHPPRLVAVSKLKPASDVLALHNPPTSHEHFGENYVQELVEKSRVLPRSIKWHFIGGLQSNKAMQLARDIPNLWAVESVDSEKKATLLDKGRRSHTSTTTASTTTTDATTTIEPLRVFIQVNTSGEDSKSGVPPRSEELSALAKHITHSCPHLRLQGLMTIGAIARSKATTPETENEDFICLRESRDALAAELGVAPEDLELSMGMSEDFEGAIRQGSSEVRVGSTIFGERPPKKDAKVLEDDGESGDKK
ncbi:YggS family pyridoxal phosphate enzyme [Exophiala spinifera]|uniref:Pyridoxal phosphate homeostasis protein n=1 Tax=Exophiala spinifera TaxID=91928 RepID=A0A0D2BPG5_9EURO|nr:YggS family pyridoxal phosphate enzyme [Exophiala spinifera]KIW20833.1 YggS family pyridoxal phosphate enzyme [Exophiala spinifera]